MNTRGDIMRICDKCFCELTEEGTYEIKDSIRKDYCNSCLKITSMKLTDTNSEKLIKKHIALINKKDENVEKLILKLRKETRDKTYSSLMKEPQIKSE